MPVEEPQERIGVFAGLVGGMIWRIRSLADGRNEGGTPKFRAPHLQGEPSAPQDFCTTSLLVTENTPGTPEAFRKAKCLSDSLMTVPTRVTSPLFTMMPIAS